MNIDFFLWPMLVPMILPLVYCAKYKKESLVEIGTIIGVIVLIVVLYWPLLSSNFLSTSTYTAVKVLLFVLLPFFALLIVKRDTVPHYLNTYGIKKNGLKKSCLFFVLFLPIMLLVTGLIQYTNGVVWNADMFGGTISFFEAFTEEFFFRGILFLFLIQRTNLKIAYITSLASFTLMHPQNISSIFIVATIIQGVLTIEIARKSQNIIGAWLLHGSNRFFQIALLPLFL
jgi:membrane protease YdiL (CAAX protease family)